MKRSLPFLVMLLVFSAKSSVLAQSAKGKDAAPTYSFYGLRFGMSPAEVRTAMPTNEAGVEALSPGHGMTYLVVSYDFRGRLQEIRASYPRPADPLEEEALRQALQEKFLQPIGARWRDISVKLDEYSNRAMITLVVTSLGLREEAIDFFKDRFLKGME